MHQLNLANKKRGEIMASKKQLLNFFVDAGLLIGFLLAFFLNLTGLDFHQWLGIFLGGFALYHLVLHFGWVKTVTTRFFHQTSWRMRGYYLLDAGILWGFISIILTGVVISSWLNLALSNYGVWREVHVWSSVITLLAVVIKIGLHWRWIVSTLGKVMTPRNVAARPALAPVLQPATSGRTVSRRQFMVMMGVVGAGALIGISNVLGEKKVVQAEAISSNATQTGSGIPAGTAPDATAVATSTQATTVVTTSAVAANSTTTGSTALACTQRCPKRKHWPSPEAAGATRTAIKMDVVTWGNAVRMIYFIVVKSFHVPCRTLPNGRGYFGLNGILHTIFDDSPSCA
jgi:hypothetical protein